MYGMAQSIPDRSVIEDVCAVYLDTTYAVGGGGQHGSASACSNVYACAAAAGGQVLTACVRPSARCPCKGTSLFPPNALFTFTSNSQLLPCFAYLPANGLPRMRYISLAMVTYGAGAVRASATCRLRSGNANATLQTAREAIGHPRRVKASRPWLTGAAPRSPHSAEQWCCLAREVLMHPEPQASMHWARLARLGERLAPRHAC
jgi:hypothetical protein